MSDTVVLSSISVLALSSNPKLIFFILTCIVLSFSRSALSVFPPYSYTNIFVFGFSGSFTVVFNNVGSSTSTLIIGVSANIFVFSTNSFPILYTLSLKISALSFSRVLEYPTTSSLLDSLSLALDTVFSHNLLSSFPSIGKNFMFKLLPLLSNN